MDKNCTGKFIAELRKEKGLTQKQLAEALGVTNKAVSKWETGGGMPDVSMLSPLCKILGIRVDELIAGEREKAVPENEEASCPQSIEPLTEQTDKPPVKHFKLYIYEKGRRLLSKLHWNPRLVVSFLCFLLFIMGAVMQFLYHTTGKAHRMVYIAGWMEYAVNGACLLLLWTGLFLLLYKKQSVSKPKRAIFLFSSICLAVIFLGNIALGILRTGPVRDIISVSPDFHTVMVLKQNRENGKVTTCRPGILWFVRESDAFPYTADEEMKIQWLETDVCAITYTSPDDDHVHQYVMTYGVRGNGITSPPVYSVLDGVWEPEDKNTAGWSFRTDVDGVHLKNGSQQMLYEYTDCVQFGTLAMVLCKKGLPQWTVVLNKDCVIDEATDLVNAGTISLCKVSMEKTAPLLLTESPFALENIPTWWESTEERGTLLKEQMQKIIQEDPQLTAFNPNAARGSLLGGSGYKIITDSTDPFQIGLLANQAELMQKQTPEIDYEIQITSMKLLAGDMYDFLLSVETSESYFYPKSEPLSDDGPSASSDTGDVEFSEKYTEKTACNVTYQYRIMKGDGVYLAAAVDYQTDGSVGLEAPGIEQSIETRNDPKYHYYTP